MASSTSLSIKKGVPGSRRSSGNATTTNNGNVSRSSIDSKHGSTNATGGATSTSHSSRPHRRKKDKSSEGVHRVTFTFTTSMAVPTVIEDDISQSTDSKGTTKKRRLLDAPKAHSYFHHEYKLLPDEEEPVRTDVVCFGIAAKIYTEKQEPKVLKTWIEGKKTWIAWSHCHTVTITDVLLDKLFEHCLQLRVWDHKEKLSTRAKFDRPKAFRMPASNVLKKDNLKDTKDKNQTDTKEKNQTDKNKDKNANKEIVIKKREESEVSSGVKNMIQKQVRNYCKLWPKKSFANRPLPIFDAAVMAAVDKVENEVAAKAAADAVVLEKEKQKRRDEISALVGDKLPFLSTGNVSTLVTLDSDRSVKPSLGARSFSGIGKLAGINKPLESRDTLTNIEGSGGLGVARRGAAPTKNTLKKKPSSKQLKSGKVSGCPLNKPFSESDLVTKSSANLNTFDEHLILSGSEDGAEKSPEKKLKINKRTNNNSAKSNGSVDAAKLANGVINLPINMFTLFSGITSITERIEDLPRGVEDMFVSIALSGPLMSTAQRKSLNPLVVTVKSAKCLPSKPLGYANLRKRCEPAFVQYKLYNDIDHRSSGLPQDVQLHWGDINVLLAGKLSPAEIKEKLRNSRLEIEVHDRDRKQKSDRTQASLFGDEPEDEKISNIGFITSKRTTNNAFADKAKFWNSYGVASFDLSGILLGQQTLNLRSPILPCPNPNILGNDDIPSPADSPASAQASKQNTETRRIFGIKGSVDGPQTQPLRRGEYLQSESMLKVKVQIAYPLTTAGEVSANESCIATDQCPFARIVYILPHSAKTLKFRRRLNEFIFETNSKSLNIDDLPPRSVAAALEFFNREFTFRSQQRSCFLDILTGVHLLDNNIHIYIIEGLQLKALQRLWESIPVGEYMEVTSLYNSDYLFSSRLYGQLDLDFAACKLHEPLDLIVRQPLLYVRDMLPKDCFLAVHRFYQLSKCTKLKDAVRNELFPSVEMVKSMSQEFAVPLTGDEDCESVTDDNQPRQPSFSAPVRRADKWQPIIHHNPEYIDYKTKPPININYEKNNIKQVNIASKHNTNVRRNNINNNNCGENLVQVELGDMPIHNYSTQTLNTGQMAANKLKFILSKTPDRRFTYSQEYTHMSVVPKAVSSPNSRNSTIKDNQSIVRRMKTWSYPGYITSIDANHHSKDPPLFRREELTKPWEENVLYGNERDVLEWRKCKEWENRNSDMNLWSKPPIEFSSGEKPAKSPPYSIQLPMEPCKTLEKYLKLHNKEIWKNKLIIDDPEFHVYRCATEQHEKGPLNQIDQLNGLLKDTPSKLSLRRPGISFNDVPPYRNLITAKMDDEICKGFKPGNDMSRGLKRDTQYLNAKDYKHDRFENANGNDFNVYHKEKTLLHKLKHQPLTSDDFTKDLFQLPITNTDPWVAEHKAEAIAAAV